MKHKGITKRLGARYGLNIKKKLGKLESMKREQRECPYCGHHAVKWLAVGIWYCKRCGKKFTGKAYTISKKLQPEQLEEAADNTELEE